MKDSHAPPVHTDDTIAAISSSAGAAPRMIIRMTGSCSHRIAARLLEHPSPQAPQVTRAQIRLENLNVPCWVYRFSHPHSYTGQDMVELHVPGNPLLARMILERLLAHGARQADPGEFTARAYFSRRMNLAQAEGVAATIAASNEQELRAARQLLSGELSRRLHPVVDLIAETLALIEAGIDFSDQDVSFLSDSDAAQRISQARNMLADLLQNSARLERLNHEPTVVLVGRPNAGKSTLLNALAEMERAVVSDVAGTTRDVLSAQVRLHRGIIRLTDVAGLDEAIERPADVQAHVSSRMQQQALRALETADQVILVQDATDPRPPIGVGRDIGLLVYTKIDLLPAAPSEHLAISAKTGHGLNQLRDRLDTLAFGSSASTASLALNTRHLTAIHECCESLARAQQNVPEAGPEILALDLRESLDALGRVLGEISPDDVLGRVFGTFCIGK
ncbi:MAG TPA: tRNA modification GTPase [Tepidisphaeraceae bacterium]